MPNGHDATRRRLEQLLRVADDAIAVTPVQAHAPILRARRAIGIRYAVISAAFVGLTVVLTATAVVARDRLVADDDDGPTATTGPTTTTPTIAPTPIVRITEPPPKLSGSTTATFGFRLIDAVSAICTINDEPARGCRSGDTFLAREGENRFEVRGVSVEGVTGPPARYRWTVDTMPPMVTFVLVELEYSRGEFQSECTMGDDIAFVCDEPVTAPPDPATFEVRLLDGTDYTLRWSLTPTPREVRFSGTGTEAFPSSSSLTLTFELDEPGTATCSVDTVPTTCEDLTVHDTFVDDGEAEPHVIAIVAKDLLGHEGPAVMFTWFFSVTSIG